ncbi:cysteine protease ATG4C [Chrysoperla carnea]|uniref:cysteine protease ATG4C n=1 Tax=Chrysoperla carnea TaxID=189513 RepID=UPI001D065E52|nr:cysteine protease ATG4C [Chrysoperla carnea]
MNTQILSRERLGFLRPQSSQNLQSSSSTSSVTPPPNNTQTNAVAVDVDESSYAEVEGKVKTRLLSMWNNMKYGWAVKIKTNFSKESPVILLGRCYRRKADSQPDIAISAGSAGNISQFDDCESDGIDGFRQDFISRVWLTYRREFPILNGSTFTSDCGWGCMLRSGQMMLAQALVCHFLGRSWRWNPDEQITSGRGFTDDATHRMIIKWFGDKPSPNSPLSIHTLVTLGETAGKRPGDWYGPASVAHILKQAVKLASKENYEFDDIAVYVSQDCAVYIQDVLDECLVSSRNPTSPKKWKSLVLLVPVRLGTEKLNPIYAPCLTTLLSFENCIGIIGGRPRHSLYFIGYQDDKLIHLDPHYCQEMVDVWAPGFPLTSFHCRSPRKMHLSKMDPSCCIGFYCHTEQDFYNFIRNIKPFLIPPSVHINSTSESKSGSDYPLFVFCNGKSSDANTAPPIRSLYPLLDSEYANFSVQDSDNDLESEEFEVL